MVKSDTAPKLRPTRRHCSTSLLVRAQKRRQSVGSYTPLQAPPPKRKRGPAPKPVLEPVRAAYDQHLNERQGRSPADLYVSNPARLFFSLACKVHVQLMSVREWSAKDLPQ